VTVEGGGVEGKGGFVLGEGAERGGDGYGFRLQRGAGSKDAMERALLWRREFVKVKGDEIVLIDARVDGVAGVVVDVLVEGTH
jgi:hypothetical protein